MAYARGEFPVSDRYAYFQHAAVSAMPRRTREAIGRVTDDMVRNGCLNEQKWRRRIEETRALAGDLLNVPTDRVGFVNSTSHGLSWVAESLPLQEGNAVLVPDVEFPANRFPWQNLQRKGIGTRFLSTDDGAFTLSDLESAFDSDVKLLALSSVQFRSGFRSDLEAVGELCRKEDVFFVVDGIQSVGWDDVKLSELPVDALAADAHKWMCGPEGVGLLYLDDVFQEKLEPALVGWQSVESPYDFSSPVFELKDRVSVVEMGSFNTIGLMGLKESLELLEDVGIDRIRDYDLDLKDRLTGELVDRSFEVAHADWPEKHHSPILALTHPRLETDGIVKKAEEQNIQLSLRDGRVRVALHFYNNDRDLERLLDFLEEQLSG